MIAGKQIPSKLNIKFTETGKMTAIFISKLAYVPRNRQKKKKSDP